MSFLSNIRISPIAFTAIGRKPEPCSYHLPLITRDRGTLPSVDDSGERGEDQAHNRPESWIIRVEFGCCCKRHVVSEGLEIEKQDKPGISGP